MTYPEWTPDAQFARMADAGVGGAVSLNDDSSEDKKLSVRFFIEPIRNEGKSRAAGRPIHDEVEMYEVRVPGETDIRRGPVTEREKARFAQRYAAFAADRTSSDQDSASGTPLREWPQMTPGLLEDLKYFGVRTVEHLAGLNDGALKKLGPGWLEWRTKAQDWLKRADAGAPIAALRHENEELKRRLTTLEGMLQKQAQEIAAARGEAPAAPVVDVAALVREQVALATAPKRRGRPPKGEQA